MDPVYKQVLDFWFQDLKPSDWFNGGDHIDALIRESFSDLHQQVVEGKFDYWRECASESLAYILVIDQFSRNLFRDKPDMYVHDGLALDIVKHGLANDYVADLTGAERLFFIMPLIHSEQLEDQQLALQALDQYCQELPNYEESKKFFARHLEIVEQFGRFPHRNKILGRESTPAEVEFLQQPFSSF